MATDFLDPMEAISSIGVTAVGAAGEPSLQETIDDAVRQPSDPDVNDYCGVGAVRPDVRARHPGLPAMPIPSPAVDRRVRPHAVPNTAAASVASASD
jgi:hypothetical protein